MEKLNTILKDTGIKPIETGVKRRFFTFNDWIDYIYSEANKTKL